MREVHADRRERVLRRLAERAPGVSALLVTDDANRFYFSGFRGDAGWLLIAPQGSFLVLDGRFWTQAALEAPDSEVVQLEPGVPFASALDATLQRLSVRRLAFHGEQISYAEHARCAEALRGVELISVPGLGEELRVVKDDSEREAIARAAAITDAAYAELLPLIQPGVREVDLAAEIEYRMRRHGAEGVAFPPIIAAGSRGALPHARPGADPIGMHDVVVVDVGARFGSYCADMTRTVLVGEPDGESRRVLDAAQRALDAGVSVLRPGITGTEVDQVVRRVIEDAGYGPMFTHGTGHGVGIEVHEAPRLSRAMETGIIPAGSVVTIEPGIYLPGRFGVRMEELVFVGEHGVEVLSRSPR